ncbi:MAG: stage V sporulation protein AE [Bacilli bacterium]|jgi:stage V sporulation protein AE|nr:stage V sporulation protein AE [Acholeplasmataceae bacterium]
MPISTFLYAFLIGGTICLIGQLLLDYFKLLPIHITVLFVVIGAFLEFFNIYDYLVEIGGAGALVPISSFGHSLTQAAVEGALSQGILGLASGIFTLTATGITAAIVFAFFAALIFKPKG